jgi:hypothetical protein
MDKTLISGVFGHFHIEVNPEMIPNLSRRAAESLKIESCLKLDFISKSRTMFLFIEFLKNFLFLESRWPTKIAETLRSLRPVEKGWFILDFFLSITS